VQGKPHKVLQLELRVYKVKEHKTRHHFQEDDPRRHDILSTHREFPTSFMKALISLIPAHFPFDSFDVVNSIAPRVCLRLSASKSLYAADIFAGRERLATSDMILLSRVTARDNAAG